MLEFGGQRAESQALHALQEDPNVKDKSFQRSRRQITCPAVALMRACAASCAISPVLNGPAQSPHKSERSAESTMMAHWQCE